MLKKFFSTIIPLIALILIISCNVSPTIDNPNGLIKVTLNTDATKGSIGVTEYEIKEVAVTLTAPDTSEETQTWVTGEDTMLVFEKKGNRLI